MAKKKLTPAEQSAYETFKKLLRKPKKLKNSDFYPGAFILFVYDAKDKTKAYDGRPLGMILGRSKKYTLALNFHWIPPKLREKIMDKILKMNKKNIKKNLPIVLNYQMIKGIIKGLGPVVRLYINKRISPKGVIIPSYEYYKVIHLRAEHFIGISSQQAWNAAMAQYKRHKAAKKAAKKQRKIDAAKAQARLNKKGGK